MARTPLFGAIQRALRDTGVAFGPRALSRRSFLALSAASLAVAACGKREGPIAIVGAGGAGLTAALRLARAGKDVTLYEANERLGGRMFTRHDFTAEGQFCELGGELVDSNHEALRNLASELGVAIDRLAPEGQEGEELYRISNRLYAQRDMINPATSRGAFVELAQRIAEDQAALLDANEDWTDHARELDQQSVAQYLTAQSNRAPTWVRSVLDIAYHGEMGIPTDEQSALNLVDFIGADPAQGFKMFGDSDEAFRVHGGSSTLTDAIAAALPASVVKNTRHALIGIAKTEQGVRLTFESPGGRIEHDFARVVLALPFTKLREVQGIEALDLGDTKLRAIRELGYGDNSKLIIATTGKPWRDPARRFPAQPAGVFYSDRFQLVWETTRAQEGENGILTNFLAGQHDREAALANMRAGLRQYAREIDSSLDPTHAAWMDWTRQPFHLGSYSGAKVGQYTTILADTATPSADGRIHFAGEHTSADFLGFMNGGIESGERVARELLES